jgi:hypothetical protein
MQMDEGDARLFLRCRNDLQATGMCLLVNFGPPKVEIRRIAAQA